MAERAWLWVENVRMLRALRDSEKQYRRIVETAQEGIWEVDALQRTTFVNERLAALLGYEQREMAGMSVFEFLSDEDLLTAPAKFEQRRAGLSG